jgi:primary-amine oxidase
LTLLLGSDGVDDDDRMWQCLFYMKDPRYLNDPDSNHYALPLPISPVINSRTRKVIRIDILPTDGKATADTIKPFVVRHGSEYVPEYHKIRTDLKPLHITQPEGTSFKVTEAPGINTIEWQKWRINLTFNFREGMVLHDVSI